MAFITTRDADLVRPGSPAEVGRLVRAGGRVIRRGVTLYIREPGEGDEGAGDETTFVVPYVLVSFGVSHRRVLVLLTPPGAPSDDLPTPERKRVVHHLP